MLGELDENDGLNIVQYGSLDMFINNAAFPKYAPFLELEEGAWENIIKVSLAGYFICAQYPAKGMVELGVQRSSENVSSIAG